MKDYKIKVNDSIEFKEATKLFEQLGFEWAGTFPERCDWFSHLYTKENKCSYLPVRIWDELAEEFKELTIPQLRDMVVLHRNDVNDANYRSNVLSDGFFFKTSDGAFYLMFEGKWVRSSIDTDEGLRPIQAQPTKQGLISGADAKLAWAKGEDVQILCAFNEFCTITTNLSLSIFDDPKNKFRLKPRTITLNVEIPAPFEPKVGEEVFYINDTNKRGYCVDEHQAHYNYNFGAWRTEEEIKQVVAALRGGIKG